MDIDLNVVLEEAAKENVALKDQIDELTAELKRASGKNQLDPKGRRYAGDMLCEGCYHWRLFVTALLGLALGLVAAFRLLGQPETLQDLARMITKRAGAETPILIGLVFITAAAPVLATVAEWKWMQFKQGRPGLLAAIVEVWKLTKNAFKGEQK
jgi:hypothetical protein